MILNFIRKCSNAEDFICKAGFILLLIFPLSLFSQGIKTKVESSNFKETPTYAEIIQWWKTIDKASNKISMYQMGPTDAGFPLHMVLVSNDGINSVASLKKTTKAVILVNNGIHPGEPDGIDASMMLVRDIAEGKKRIPMNVILAIIPVYNIGGCLNRSANYRVDQNGPEAFGSRGNSRNFDLNRDFIKSDSREARSFAEIFHACDPDVFIDNHVSNGADYQHIMTLLSSQHNKLGGEMGKFLEEKFEPALYSMMKEKGFDLVPYVNHFSETPDKGWPQFFDAPRYSSGYATLFQTFGFTPETHMLKPYEQRVRSTYALMETFIEFVSLNAKHIISLREDAKNNVKRQEEFPLDWENDKEKFKEIEFKGYQAGKKNSDVSGLPRLYYDRSKPYTKMVPFYNLYKPVNIIQRPKAYIIPQGWWPVIDLLKANKVTMRRLEKDSSIEVEVYRIESYKSSPRQYEGHHYNSEIKTSTSKQSIRFRKGDYYIPMDQRANRFLMEVLEPTAPDSYFAWNYFDAILGQKEGYSHYVFEDTAAELLEKDPSLKQQLEERKRTDTTINKSASAQLNFIFRNSPFYEPDHMRYPVFRVF